jgi:pyridoxal phosphate-dependent aminotransferase EpsN
MQTSNKRIYLCPPHMSGKEKSYIDEAFASNWIAPLGPQVDAFENEIEQYIKCPTLALSSGTAALHLALRLLGIEQGDMVFCSALTFIGSVNPVLYLGSEPVFIDSEPESWNMSPVALEKAFAWAKSTGKMPKAVIIVDLYGQSADYEPLLDLCNEYGVPVVEDAAEAVGASYKGKACGTLGRFGVFSFNGNKIITTSGGGMLVADDKEALKKALFWATQARDPAPWYQHSEVGYNYRMSNIVAAIGRGQLQVLDERVKAHRAVFERYQEALGDIPGVGFMPEPGYGKCNRWLTVMTLDPDICKVKPMQVIEGLAKENIESRPVWKPMHLQPLFKGCKYFTHGDDESIGDRLFASGVCLPSGSGMTDEEQQRVIRVVRSKVSQD